MQIDMEFLETYRRYAYKQDKRNNDALEGIILDYCKYNSEFEELRKRLVWLLERNPVFKKGFGETQKLKPYGGLIVTERLPEISFLYWWYWHVFSKTEFGKIVINKRNPPVSAAENGKKSKVIEWTHHGLLIELMILKGFADKHGWGLDNGNFWRDTKWFELHAEWQNLTPRQRRIEAEILIDLEDYNRDEYTNDRQDKVLRLIKEEGDLHEVTDFSNDNRDQRVKKLFLRKKLSIKYLILNMDNNHPEIVDRMVLEYMRRSNAQLLKSADPEGKIEGNGKSRKLRDYELLCALGVFIKAKIKKDYSWPLKIWPAYSSEDSDGICAGQACYLRYDHDHNKDDNVAHWFEVLDPCPGLEMEKRRNDFSQYRKSYIEKSDAPLVDVVKKALERLREQIDTVILVT